MAFSRFTWQVKFALCPLIRTFLSGKTLGQQGIISAEKRNYKICHMYYPGARLAPKKKNFSGLLLKKFIKLDFKNEPTQKFFDISGK